jgi:hypothetical protein
VASTNRADYRPLGGKSRRYVDVTTGQTISRRQYDRLFRLGPRGFASHEQLAARRATAGAGPMPRTLAKIDRAVARVLQLGESPARAARAVGLAPETLRRYARPRGLLAYNRHTRRGEVWAAGSVSFFDAGGALRTSLFDQRDIRTMSAYGQALQAAKRGRPAALRTFDGVTVRDVYGREYALLTNLDAYFALEAQQGEDPMDFFVSGQTLVTGAASPAA